MTLPTAADFNNAKRDIDDIAEIVTSPVIKDVANRKGGQTPTLAKVMKRLSDHAPVRNRGTWVSGIQYEVNDIWQAVNDVWYVVVEEYVSGATEQVDIDAKKVFVHQVNIATDSCKNITNLRLFEPSEDGQIVKLLGVEVPGIGGGDFFHDAGDTASEDNGGNLIVTVSGKRWRRNTETFLAVDFGVIPDGVTDCTAAARAVHLAADGDVVYYPKGKVLIKGRIDSGSVDIRIKGVNGNFQHKIIMSKVPGVLNEELLGSLAKSSTVFICDNTALIGEVDTDTVLGANNHLKLLQNCALVGINSARIGVHFLPISAKVSGVLTANFGWFGIITRSGVTSVFEKLGFDTNGYDLAETGDVTATNYGSGCDFKVGSDKTPGSYHTVYGPDRPTTFSFRDIYHTPCHGYVNATYSGLRAMQVHGLQGATFDRVGAYFGYYCHIAENVTFDGLYVENYAGSGGQALDNKPIGLFLSNCKVTLLNYNTYSLAEGAPVYEHIVEVLGIYGKPYNMIQAKGDVVRLSGNELLSDGILLGKEFGYLGVGKESIQRALIRRSYNSGTNRSSTQIGVPGTYGGEGEEATTPRLEIHQDGSVEVNDGRLLAKGLQVDTRKDGSSALILAGAGSPEAIWAAPRGSMYQRTDGGAGTSFYVKESGDGTASGWVAK